MLCFALPFTHISIIVELMQITNAFALAKFVGMLPVLEDNLSSMIYLSSNGFSGPKRTLNWK
jgi:hypothetical protein